MTLHQTWANIGLVCLRCYVFCASLFPSLDRDEPVAQAPGFDACAQQASTGTIISLLIGSIDEQPRLSMRYQSAVLSSAVQRNPATKSRERHNRPRRAPGEGLRTAMDARRKRTSDLGLPAHYESYVATGVTRLQTRDKGRGAVASRKGFEAGQGSLSTIYAPSQIQMLPRPARPLIRPTWRSGPRLHAARASPWKLLGAPERVLVRFCRPRSTRPRSRGQLPSHKHAPRIILCIHHGSQQDHSYPGPPPT